MKSKINGKLKNTIYNLMRDLGYHFQGQDEKTKELGFTRPKSGYPHLHLFVKIENGDLFLSLHLDQKKPVYDGATAHSGDYDGPVVENEMARIKQYLEDQTQK
jgi:hypothetical protein